MDAATEPEKILIVRLGALGDIVHAIPAQQQLRRRFPRTEIHWLCEAPYAPLLRTVAGLDRVWVADTRKWRRGRGLRSEALPLFRDLRRQRFDLALDFQGLTKSALMARLAKPGLLIGFRPERFKEWGSGRFYDRVLEGEADLGHHVCLTNLRLSNLVIGNGAAPTAGPLPLSIPPPVDEDLQRRLSQIGVDSPPALINPGAGWVTKEWPPERYLELGEQIEARLDLPVFYTYGPGEEGLIEAMRRRATRPLKSFPTSILELAALCRRARLFIGGDTGPLHVAAALGVPTVAIMGPTTPERNGPCNPLDEVVHYRLPCSDCYKRTCDKFICMDMPVEEVLRAVLRRLRREGLARLPTA